MWHGYWRGPTERDVLLILASDTEQGSLSDNRKSLITLGLGDGTADSEKTKVIPASQSWRSQQCSSFREQSETPPPQLAGARG